MSVWIWLMFTQPKWKWRMLAVRGERNSRASEKKDLRKRIGIFLYSHRFQNCCMHFSRHFRQGIHIHTWHNIMFPHHVTNLHTIRTFSLEGFTWAWWGPARRWRHLPHHPWLPDQHPNCRCAHSQPPPGAHYNSTTVTNLVLTQVCSTCSG